MRKKIAYDKASLYTQRNLFEIIINQTEIILYFPFSDWFGATNGQCQFAVTNQTENGKYNIILTWFNKISKIFPCVLQTLYPPSFIATIHDTCMAALLGLYVYIYIY